MNNLVYIKQNRCLTNSKELAEEFGKLHKDVLRKIENQLSDLPEEFGQRNFTPSSYANEQNKEQPMVEMTKDGFMAIAMTFTGKIAAAFRVKVIEEFNRRGDELDKRGLPTHSMEDLLDMAAAEIRKQKLRADEAETKVQYYHVKADLAESQVRIQQKNASSLATSHGLTGYMVFENYEVIRNAVIKWWPNSEVKDKSKYPTDGAKTTTYLRMVWGVEAPVRKSSRCGPVSLFDLTAIEEVVSQLSKTEESV